MLVLIDYNIQISYLFVVIEARCGCASDRAISKGSDLDGKKETPSSASVSQDWGAVSEGEVSVKSKYDIMPLELR